MIKSIELKIYKDGIKYIFNKIKNNKNMYIKNIDNVNAEEYKKCMIFLTSIDPAIIINIRIHIMNFIQKVDETLDDDDIDIDMIERKLYEFHNINF